MARPIYQYQLDQKKNTIPLGISLPFNVPSGKKSPDSNYAASAEDAGSVFVSTYSTEEQVISNIKNLLLTAKGERFMQPDFGTQIVDSLFEQSTEDLETSIEDGLNEDIATWLPYIIVDGINVERVIDQHMLNISLEFRITENGANQVIKILLDENGVEINNSIL